MSETPTRLVLRAPGPDTPGFLRRQRAVVTFQQRIAGDDLADKLQALAELADWLIDFVIDPPDRVAAYNALLDASQAQLEAAMVALGNPTTQPEMSGATSGAG